MASPSEIFSASDYFYGFKDNFLAAITISDPSLIRFNYTPKVVEEKKQGEESSVITQLDNEAVKVESDDSSSSIEVNSDTMNSGIVEDVANSQIDILETVEENNQH